jgi:hypothetical protein
MLVVLVQHPVHKHLALEVVGVALVQLDQLEQVLHHQLLEVLSQERLVVQVDQVYQLVLLIVEMVALEVKEDFQQDLTQENIQDLLADREL